MNSFLENKFPQAFEEILSKSKKLWPGEYKTRLTNNRQLLSPSDFGFHNTLITNEGLKFIDFEYFGWDDPVKLIADFIWHPAMTLSDDHKKRWLENSFKIFKNTEEIQQRFHAAWPLYGMRWAMILLNEFSHDGWEKKLHVDENVEKFREKKLSEQIDKAVAKCDLIKSNQMECPYD